MDTTKFLKEIKDSNGDVRFNAWRAAGEVDPVVIPELAKLAASENPGIAKAAREALTTMTHSVGKDPKSVNRQAVVKGLLAIDSALAVRIHALRLLSNIAGEDSVAAIAKDIHNQDLREEVVYCLERIPGTVAMEAMVKAYPQAKDDFKPRLLAAFGHRKDASNAVLALCAQATRSGDKAIAVAGAKAFARIGPKSISAFPLPSEAGLNETQKTELLDSRLRFADAQLEQGNPAAALETYKAMLERSEEHLQCAAIVGIAKIATAEAAAILMHKMKSANRNVRITAQKAWKGLAPA